MVDENSQRESSGGLLRLKITLPKRTLNDENDEVELEKQHQLYLTIKELHKIIAKKDPMNIFANPVTDDIAPGYSTIISNPVDLSTILERISSKNHYKTVSHYLDDLILMCNNCMTYNTPDTIFYQHARKMLNFIEKQLTLNKVNKIRAAIGYTEPFDQNIFGSCKRAFLKTNTPARSLRKPSSPSSSEESEDIRPKKRSKPGNKEHEGKLIEAFPKEVTPERIIKGDDEEKSNQSDKKFRINNNSNNFHNNVSFNTSVKPLLFANTDEVLPKQEVITPQLNDFVLVEDNEEPMTYDDSVYLEDIREIHEHLRDKIDNISHGYLEADESKNLKVKFLDKTNTDVNYSEFMKTAIAEKNFKKAFEFLPKISEDPTYVAKLNALNTLNFTPKEPIAINFHGPLKGFPETELSHLLNVYGGDVQSVEYVFSLLRFTMPIGDWAKNWADKTIDSHTAGQHFSLKDYFAKEPCSEKLKFYFENKSMEFDEVNNLSCIADDSIIKNFLETDQDVKGTS